MAIKTVLLASLALLATTAGLYLLLNTPTTDKTYLKSFMIHKRKYNKLHANREDLEYRFSVYVENMKFIEDHNTQRKSFSLAENQFADLTFEEFRQKYLAAPIPNSVTSYHSRMIRDGEVDWVKEGKVSRVKNQKACGSCWAFSTTGSLESAYAIYYNKNIEFSEQELVDCAGEYGNNGCNGGMMSYAFDYIHNNKLATEEEYPYTAQEGTCKDHRKDTERYGINSYDVINPVDVTGLVDAVHTQPVSVAIEVRKDFMHYSTGIYSSDESCGESLNHGVMVVGYKNADDEKYFKVKNSWGDLWGEKGYIRMAIGTGSGTCGIANETDVYPRVN